MHPTQAAVTLFGAAFGLDGRQSGCGNRTSSDTQICLFAAMQLE
jgi:hypothetical protein